MAESSRELQHALNLSQRILTAAEHLFSDSPLSSKIVQLASDYEQRCRDILRSRGGSLVTIAIVGSKGQGKTWVAKQLILDPTIRDSLPSGVLTHEATTQLYWIGPTPPVDLDPHSEQFIYCPTQGLLDTGFPYICLDTPGMTDSNRSAARTARQSLAVAPVQLLVIRRDQLRSAASSQLVSQSEGIFCVPIVTAIPTRELSADGSASEALQSDVLYWQEIVRSTAPYTQFQDPILIADFEATGDEPKAEREFRSKLTARLKGNSLKELGQSSSNRLAAAASRLKYDVHRSIEQEAPQLARAVIRMQEEARLLPKRAIESVLGSELILETAIRARLRTQIVTDTGAIFFPYRQMLSLLSYTQGAWDRLILAMSGSLPSIFGTFAAWAKNVQQTRKIQWDMQEGLRERLNAQAVDQLLPIQRQFSSALSQLRGPEAWGPAAQQAMTNDSAPVVRLAGIDELQSRSQSLFNQRSIEGRSSRWVLGFLALVGTALFWAFLSGPILSVYRQYLSASYQAFIDQSTVVEKFPHPTPSFITTSILLSIFPLLIYSMIVLTILLRRSRVMRLARTVHADQHSLVEQLQDEGILRLEFQDISLQQAHFLLGLDPTQAK